MTSTDQKTFTAPCGARFYGFEQAKDHEWNCDQCAGATEAHETAHLKVSGVGQGLLGYDGRSVLNPTHETVSAMFDRTHADNAATIADILEMVEDGLDRRDIETARELMADARLLLSANARIEACWTVKA